MSLLSFRDSEKRIPSNPMSFSWILQTNHGAERTRSKYKKSHIVSLNWMISDGQNGMMNWNDSWRNFLNRSDNFLVLGRSPVPSFFFQSVMSQKWFFMRQLLLIWSIPLVSSHNACLQLLYVRRVKMFKRRHGPQQTGVKHVFLYPNRENVTPVS